MSTEKRVFSAGLAAKICRAWSEAGGDPEEFNALSERGSVLRQVVDVVRGRSEIRPVEHFLDLNSEPFIPQSWSVEEHHKGEQLRYDPKKVELFLSNQQRDGQPVKGVELYKEYSSLITYNANLLDFYLRYPYLIPEDWRTKYVFFWGTVYRDAVDYLCVRYLCWFGDRWGWYHLWLDCHWCMNSPVVVFH